MSRTDRTILAAALSRVARLSVETGWVALGQCASVAGSLVLLRMVTDRLGPSEYGRLALALTLAGLVNQVVMGGVGGAVLRYYSIALERHDILGFVRAGGVLLAGATGVLVAGAAGLVAVLLATSWVEFVGLVASTMLFALCSGYTHALNCLFNAARIRSVVAVGAGVEAVGRVAMVAGVTAYVGPTSTAVMIGYAGAAVPLLLVQLALAKRMIRGRIVTEVSASAAPWVRQMWIFSWPLMAAGVFNWAYFASQRWSLELFVSTAEVGRFYALTQVASAPVAVAGSLLMTTIQPVLYSRMGDPSSSLNREYVRRALRLVVRLGLLGTLALVIAAATLHDWAYRILVSSDYSELSSLLPAVVAATSLLQVSIALGSYIAITNNTRAGLVKDVVGNAAVAAINMLFTYLAGVHGLVAGMVVGALIHLSWTYRVVSRLK